MSTDIHDYIRGFDFAIQIWADSEGKIKILDNLLGLGFDLLSSLNDSIDAEWATKWHDFELFCQFVDNQSVLTDWLRENSNYLWNLEYVKARGQFLHDFYVERKPNSKENFKRKLEVIERNVCVDT